MSTISCFRQGKRLCALCIYVCTWWVSDGESVAGWAADAGGSPAVLKKALAAAADQLAMHACNWKLVRLEFQIAVQLQEDATLWSDSFFFWRTWLCTYFIKRELIWQLQNRLRGCVYPSSLSLWTQEKRKGGWTTACIYMQLSAESEHANATVSYLLYSTAFATMFSLMERMTPWTWTALVTFCRGQNSTCTTCTGASWLAVLCIILAWDRSVNF